MNCKGFSFSVAFISDAAIQLLVDSFRNAQLRGVSGKILTTDYMFGTSPAALRRLMRFPNIEVRVFSTLNKNTRGFHTKGYIFEFDDRVQLTVGSSNLTEKALKHNHEWNLSYFSKENPRLINTLYSEFDELWNDNDVIPLTNEYIDQYEKQYNHEKYSKSNQQILIKQLVEFLKDNTDTDMITRIADIFDIETEEVIEYVDEQMKGSELRPNYMQEIALESLQDLRSKGQNKGLVIAATGTGKTFLAAFDVLQVSPKRLLFVVHREKILKDAMKTFKTIHNASMGLYTGTEKSINADYVFASIQTLSREKNLFKLAEDTFDYIIIDEAHRSATPTYNRVLNHFKPKFLLGLTATPERTDTNSIFEIFDNQVAAEIRLRDALKENLVVPFHYFGIEDATTDLSDIDVSKEIDIVADRLNIKARVDLIIENILKYGHSGNKTKALGFCLNVKQAEYMSAMFNERGMNSVSLSALTSEYDREIYIEKLEDENDPLSYIFTVDIFNEGIDIPSVNLVLMLRPTQSPIVFTQQLGRGLRLHPLKDYLTVLDFIGNHNKTFMIPIALSGQSNYDKDDIMLETKSSFSSIPGDTFIRLEEKTMTQILSQLERYNFDDMKNLKEIYYEVKREINRIPSLLDYGFDGLDPVRFIDKSKSYLEFVKRVDNDFAHTLGEDIIRSIRFIDSLLPAKRIYEFAILEQVIRHHSVSYSDMVTEIEKHIERVDYNDLNHAIDHLTGDLLNEQDKKRFILPVEKKNGYVNLTDHFITLFDDQMFKQYYTNSIEYGIRRYQHEFGRKTRSYPAFKLYYQYENREISQIARYDSIYVIQSGVSSKKNDYFLFVTLDKSNARESLKFKDEFINRKEFQWQSPNNTTNNSKTGSSLINHKGLGINIHLFIKKGGSRTDFYSKKFIYIGKVDVLSHKEEKPITFKFRLHNEVPEDVYFKLTTEYQNDEEKN
ncbi:DUF3427 domain-containing protein [Paracholeplasma morum]|uniref:DUF3427 domain-containing protein n=1 Tax=Paracholeplasma morum TaxID=264637 RepID=UPI00195B4895|nr:DUF3427 domain-containing protein [Paracholeplasma morum]